MSEKTLEEKLKSQEGLRKLFSQKEGNKNWALVELHRWQYGQLPEPTDTRKLDIGKALKKIANGIITGDVEKMISPMNICAVLYFLADNYEFEE